MLTAALSGFALSLSLILAIGAQNAFVLRQGLRGQHVLPVVLTCAISDALLITAGVAGFAVLSEFMPKIAPFMRYAGAAFLFVYGLMNLRSAWVGGSSMEAADSKPQPLWSAVSVCLALTWLNPHVYLDTVLLIGSVSTKFPDHTLAFGIGAVSASFVFFFSLGYGAALLRPIFAKPSAWRVLDVIIGLTMWAIALGLILSH